jgi:hypothetical protein
VFHKIFSNTAAEILVIIATWHVLKFLPSDLRLEPSFSAEKGSYIRLRC